MPSIANCRLCFNECDEENGLGYNSKLPDLCCKYLHSSLTQKVANQSNDQPFCPKCYVSAMELIVLSEQMEFIQKSVSELVFIFSMEILHRRTKLPDSEKQEALPKRLIEFDVSALPNVESWSTTVPPPIFDTPSTSAENSQEIVTENIYVKDVEDLIQFDNQMNEEILIDEALIDEIKCENNVEVWIEEGASSSMDFGELLEMEPITEFPPESVIGEGCNYISPPKIETHLPTPILQLPKLKLHHGGREIEVEKDMDYFMFNHGQMSELGKTIWTKSDSGGSYKITRQNPTSSNYKCNVQPEPQPQIPISTEPMSVNPEATVKSPNRRRRQKTNKTSQGDQNKEKPYKCSFCKKRFKLQSRMITHKMGHIGEKPYQCFLCPKSFIQPNSLSYHQQLYHSKARSPQSKEVSHQLEEVSHQPKERVHPPKEKIQCAHCNKLLSSKFSLMRHNKLHTGEKPFRCDKCDYASAQPHNLRIHKIRIHTNFKCKACGNSFQNTGDAIMHFKRVHSDLEFSDECIVTDV